MVSNYLSGKIRFAVGAPVLTLCLQVFLLTNTIAQNFTSTWPDGQKREQGDTLDGARTGEWTAWYNNGTTWSIGAYEKGKKIGLWKYWYRNGKKWSELNLVEGLCFSWYQNGGKEKEGSVKDGKNEGLWQYWHPNSEL